MASIFQNENGTWNYGTKIYGSLSEAQEAERREMQKNSGMFLGNSSGTSSSSGSLIGSIIKIGLFVAVCLFVAKYWYIVLPIAVLILVWIIRGAIKKSHSKKVALNFEKIEEFYQKEDATSIYLLLKENADKYKDAESMYYLALVYKNGEGTKPSEEQYMVYLEKSAKHGYSMAQYLYGSIIALDNENATEEEKRKGFKYLKKSVNDYKNSEIQSYRYNLALAYYTGTGTKKDEKRAIRILEELAKNGNSDAKETLEKIR